MLLAIGVQGLVVLAARPSPAPAATPKLTTTLLVPGKSVGGVRIGMTLKQVRSAWGSRGLCEPARSPSAWCSWRGKPVEAGVDVHLRKGKVTAFSLVSGSDGQHPLFGGSVGTLRTKDGVGLGSTEADVLTAFPAISGLSSPLGLGVSYTLTTRPRTTELLVDPSARVVVSIGIG